MPDINYIKHLNTIFEQFAKDNKLNPTHISLYIGLFQIWNYNRFPEEFYVHRQQVMQLSKIGSKTTYHRCISDLDAWNYVKYKPSHNPFKGSRIRMYHFGTTDKQEVDLTEPISGQAMVSFINSKKQIENFLKLDTTEKKNEIVDFFKKEKCSLLEAEKFFNHYEGIGWKLGGRHKIVDWQAVARNWILNAQNYRTKETKPTGPGNLHVNNDKNYAEPL
jgi:hypothetical protein